LFEDENLLRAKLVEEANELADAKTKDEVIGETADVIYFALVAAAKAGRFASFQVYTKINVCFRCNTR
jgi:phosphoribosyl-ATP pyrophosphohydrolase/phosphoribosyl-AMP cyclohydrolase/histidinol dehydrogenase